VSDWLSGAASARPEHPFLVSGTVAHSFAEIEAHVAAGAARLRSAGVVEETVVGLWATNSVDSVVEMLAIWRAGGIVQLVNTRLTPGEARQQVHETNAHMVVGRSVPDIGVRHVVLDTTPAAGGVPAVATPEERVAWIVYTSGSSGRPKGVRLTFGNLEAGARASAAHLGHGPDDRWLCDLPIFHVGGASILIRSLRQTSTVVLEPRFDPARAAGLLRAGDATLASMVATTLARTLDVHPQRYTGVKAVLVGGGPVPFDLLERARTGGLPAVATYGLTETASQIATGRLTDGKVVPLPLVEIRTVDGHIEVRGPMLFKGYVGDPDRDRGSWFRTGDLGVVHDDGTLEVLGRADEVIISGGENVHPAEVEAVIAEHPAVSGIVVMGEPDQRWGTVAIAVYEGEAAPGELERHARYRLAGYKIPKRWIHVDELPRISIGKIDRAAVRRMQL
jgi:O-succinylbenzoic acid--CoA ligase